MRDSKREEDLASRQENAAAPTSGHPSAAVAKAIREGADRRQRAEARMQGLGVEYYRRLTEAARQATVQANQIYDISQRYVQAHPGTVTLGALGAGLVIGILSARR